MKNFYKKTCSPLRRGISIIEILFVISVLGIIFSVVVPQFSKSREMQVLKSGVGDILSSIDKARVETLSSLDSSSYGVHFQSDKVIIFKGTVFSDSDVNNEIINIVTPATISNIALQGGGSDFYFNRLSGMPSTAGTLMISTTSYSKIITISATGSASSN